MSWRVVRDARIVVRGAWCVMRDAQRETSHAKQSTRAPLRIVAILFMLASLVPFTHAIGRNNLGTTGGQFLKLSISPRVAALAEAYGALGDDAAAIYSNPAGLSVLPQKQVHFTHAQLVSDIYLNSIFYAHPIPKPFGTFAVNYTMLDYGDLIRTSLNPVGSATPYSLNGNFSAYDHLLSVAYADDFLWRTHRFRWGITAKFINQTIAEESATGLAYDLGIIYAPVGRAWRLGATVQNLGFLSKFRYEADPLPLTLKLSAGSRFFRDKLRLGLDANFATDNTPVVSVGAEVVPIPQLALRGGYRFDDNTSDYVGATVGAGFNMHGIAIDYAYVPFERLGANHRFSLGYTFGEVRRDPDYVDGEVVSRGWGRPTPSQPAVQTVSSTRRQVSVSVESEEPSLYVEPATQYEPVPQTQPQYQAAQPQPEPARAGFGVRAMPFAYAGGPPEYDWIGASTMEVLHKNWTRKGTFSSSGPFVVEGDCSISNGILTINARLSLDERLLGSFTESGDPDLPFEAWDRITQSINGRLASLGIK